MLDRIIQALQGDKRFSAWQVTETAGRSHQRYSVFGQVETLREVEKRSFRVEVHVEHAGEKDAEGHALVGESSFVVAGKGGDLGRELDLAFERARLVKNRAWTLPGPSDAGAAAEVALVDPHIVERPGDAVLEIAARIGKAADQHREVELASSEVFCDFSRARLVNSLGLEREGELTDVYTEYVLLAKGKGGEDESEVYRSSTARRLEDLDVEGEVGSDVRATVDGLSAKLPSTGVADVVIADTAVAELFDAFVAHASGSAAFEGWSRLTLGAPIVGELEGEPLTLSSDATLPGGLGSYPFDPHGLAARRVTLIDGGRFVARCNDRRYGCWLREPATGALGNVVVASGARAEAELLAAGERPLYHLLRFSQLTPHAYSGAFSGEIRHGYRVDPDGTRTPIKGGSISGVVFDAFQRAFYSKERIVQGRTHAPRAVRLDRIQVTGA